MNVGIAVEGGTLEVAVLRLPFAGAKAKVTSDHSGSVELAALDRRTGLFMRALRSTGEVQLRDVQLGTVVLGNGTLLDGATTRGLAALRVGRPRRHRVRRGPHRRR